MATLIPPESMPMESLPLAYRNSHLFLQLEDGLWLYDTGAPASFGDPAALRLLGQNFEIPDGYMGLNAAGLSGAVDVDCLGLLGADVINAFDQILDVAGGRLTISEGELRHPGEVLGLDEFMGIPIVSATVAGEPFRLFFDTGAQLSYLQDDLIEKYPSAGLMEDFYPGCGRFETETHMVVINLGSQTHTLRCGQLPGLLGMSLKMADTAGILGNSILQDRTVGYFPRRSMLSL